MNSDTPDFTLGKPDTQVLLRAIKSRLREITDDPDLLTEYNRLTVLYTYIMDCFEVRIITE